MPRYFYSELASRPLVEGTMRIEFEGIGIFGGRLCGIFETVNEHQEALLMKAVNSRVGVSEIRLEEFLQLKAQKKTPNSPTLKDSALPPVSRGPALADKVGVAHAVVPEAVELSSEKLLTPAECIVIGPVNSPEALVAEHDRMAPVSKNKRKRAA